MVRLNRARLDYQEKFEELIAEYNNGALNIEDLFDQLVDFAQSLTLEDQRATREELTEEELALFDILTKPALSLTDAEIKQVKRVARELLETLKQKKLVIDWRKKQQARAAVKLCIREFLGQLPVALHPGASCREDGVGVSARVRLVLRRREERVRQRDLIAAPIPGTGREWRDGSNA